jgi:hypothetical protein
MGLSASEFASGISIILFSSVITSCMWYLIGRILNLKENSLLQSVLAVSAYNAPLAMALLFSTGYAESFLGEYSSVLSVLFFPASLLALFFSLKYLYGWKTKKTFIAFLMIFFCSLLSYISIFLIRPLI